MMDPHMMDGCLPFAIAVALIMLALGAGVGFALAKLL